MLTSSSQSKTQTTLRNASGGKRKIDDYFPKRRLDATQSPSQATAASVTPKPTSITADDGSAAANQPAAKRVKREETVGEKKTKLRQNSRAKLRMFPLFPFDVILEIFSHLVPLDLLHLSRTTKDLRAIIMHRSSAAVWRSAMASVRGMPLCPEDVSIPSWAHLVFDTYCQNCLAPNVRYVNFELRVRICTKCSKLFSAGELDLAKDEFHKILHGVLMFSTWNSREDMTCTVKEKEEFIEKYNTMPQHERHQLIETKRAAKRCHKKLACQWNDWFEERTESRLAKIFSIRLYRSNVIRKKLRELGYSSELFFLDQLSIGICAIRPLPDHEPLDDLPDVRKPQPLTEKGWERIKPRLIKHMEKTRVLVNSNNQLRLVQKREALLHNAYVCWRRTPDVLAAYPPDMFLPGVADILASPPFCEFIQNGRQTQEEDFDHERATDLIKAHYPLLMTKWRKEKVGKLFEDLISSRSFVCDFLAEYITLPYISMERKLHYLERAICVFRCNDFSVHYAYNTKRFKDDGIWDEGSPRHLWDVNEDHEPCLWYPHFLFHPCTTMAHDDWYDREKPALSMENEYKRNMVRVPWDSDKLKFDETASKIVRQLLKTAGLPITTTTEEMDDLDHRFVCLKCTFGAKCNGSRVVRVWSWRDAVQHSMKAHFGSSIVTWECLSPEDAQIARKLQIAEGNKRGYLDYPANRSSKRWRCMCCRDTPSDVGRMRLSRMKNHFLSNPFDHPEFELDREDELYYEALDYCPRKLPPVRMAPAAQTP
ncbi:hypothetical protein JR316_0000095 [Psilocybe cubensis]|uniref:Uncharacterized protein n=2 Tax=Psilocybe cubensis TaxID=181762 RepID=A0ACB8HDS4_PSICU|nr:hypothetical protein JR316_0000095 [Psilocybe cubensis]KAH9486031.1 hypothetical protein JR316_0000095 [Psilocybe cubensis]